MRSMGLDISFTETGLVVLEKAKGMRKPNVLVEKVVPPEDGLPRYRKVVDIAEKVHAIVDEFEPDLITIEGFGQGAHRNVTSFIKLVETGAAIRLGLVERGIEWIELPPTSLKKFVTGSGKTPKGNRKQPMLNGVRKEWAFVTKNHNIADAFGLAAFGLAHAGVLPIRDWQVDAMDKVSIASQAY